MYTRFASYLIIILVFVFSINRILATPVDPNAKEDEYFNLAQQKIDLYHPKKQDLVIIIDYRKDIFSERLFLLDMKTRKIILQSTVAHAWNSGYLKPTEYSNVEGTNKSSKGVFMTKNSTYGKFGYSMVVKGLEKGINDNAQRRAIIFHSTKKMRSLWSHGCFATDESVNKKLIDQTKGGVLVCVIT